MADLNKEIRLLMAYKEFILLCDLHSALEKIMRDRSQEIDTLEKLTHTNYVKLVKSVRGENE